MRARSTCLHVHSGLHEHGKTEYNASVHSSLEILLPPPLVAHLSNRRSLVSALDAASHKRPSQDDQLSRNRVCLQPFGAPRKCVRTPTLWICTSTATATQTHGNHFRNTDSLSPNAIRAYIEPDKHIDAGNAKAAS